MPEFKLTCENFEGDRKFFYYNTENSSLKDESGEYVVPLSEEDINSNLLPAFSWSKNNPAVKSNNPKHLKISLGLSCNYSCNYCSQRFVPHADSTSSKHVPKFLEMFPKWYGGGSDGKGMGTRIEFWGGEPLVYWKTLKPLATGIKELYPNAQFGMITNGSLLDEEKVNFLVDMGFGVGISHDGPGYHVRGEDPLDDPKVSPWIYELYNRLRPSGSISFNAMIHKDNPSRKAVQDFLVEKFGEDVPIGEGGFIDAYDDGAIENSLTTIKDQILFRRQAIHEIRNSQCQNFSVVSDKINTLLSGIHANYSKFSLNQKCGIDNPSNVTIDLLGNVITCQNVSSAATAPNGESHHCGTIEKPEDIKVKSITSWQHRPNCGSCPVIHACRGSCTFLEGDLWDHSCNNSYSDNIVFLAAAVELLTGYLPIYIEGGPREDRKDIWGLFELKDELTRPPKLSEINVKVEANES
jgi:uncharacterized protein